MSAEPILDPKAGYLYNMASYVVQKMPYEGVFLFAHMVIVSTLAAVFVGYFYSHLRYGWQMFTGQDLEHIVISTTHIEEVEGKPTLIMRPYGEGIPIGKMFDNPLLAKEFARAVKGSARIPDHALLSFKNNQFEHEIMNALRRKVTSPFARDYLARMCGHSQHEHKLVVMPVCETYEGMIIRQVHLVIMLESDVKEGLVNAGDIALEVPYHHYRVKTINDIKAAYANLSPQRRRDYTADVSFHGLHQLARATQAHTGSQKSLDYGDDASFTQHDSPLACAAQTQTGEAATVEA